jgi:hypothetical protein
MLSLLKLIIFLLFFVLLIRENANAQNVKTAEPISTMSNPKQYPRIEVYSEIDKGDPNAGNNQWIDSNGNTVYGGRASYQPHILRKTYLISEGQKAKLLQTALHWLPYFGEKKENTTLEHYFQAAANTDRYSLYQMLPQNLNWLLTQKLKGEDYSYHNTLLVYEASHPQEFTVVWLDENTWFVNEVFYNAAGNFQAFMQDGQEDIVAKAQFDDFLRLSSIFQHKLTEGFPSIKLHPTQTVVPLDEVVLEIALSPGMPNTVSYSIRITGDGSLMQQGFKSKQKIDPNTLTAILLEAQKLNWESYYINDLSKMSKAAVHDRQSFSISAWKNGRLYHITDPDLSSESAPLSIFVKRVKEVVEIK